MLDEAVRVSNLESGTASSLPAQCPLLALSGHFSGPAECPLLGVKRTSLTPAQMSACDPKRTLLLFARMPTNRLPADLSD